MPKDLSYLKKYQYKPKYTKEDMKTIREELEKETPVEDIFAIMKRKRPDVHVITIYRWIERVASEG